MTESLAGKVVLITGASRGIGRAIAETFRAEGARLVLVARSEFALLALERDLAAGTADVCTLAADVRDEETASRAVDAAFEHFGCLDILVNNAGIAIHKPVIDLTPAEYDEVMDTNMRATFLFSRAVVPAFLRLGHGSIINIGSGAATRGIATESAYCASKFAQRGFSLALDRELRQHNVRITLILPGNVDTAFNGRIPSTESKPPHGDMMSPADVARAALFAATATGNGHMVEMVIRPMLDSV